MACYLTTASTCHLLVVLTVSVCLHHGPYVLAFGFAAPLRPAAYRAPALVGQDLYRRRARRARHRVFPFFVIALDQGSNGCATKSNAPIGPIQFGKATTLSSAPQPKCRSAMPAMDARKLWLCLAILPFAIVFGAFAANVLFGAMRAVPARNLKPPKPMA